MVWIQKLDHGGQQSNGRALAIDSDDNVIVAGAIHEEITGGGYSSGFVAKLSGTDGSITWQRILNDDVQANGYHSDSFMAVTVDSNKDVYTTGYNNFEYLGTSYSPIVKLSGTDGSITWQRRHLTTNGSTGISAVGTSVYVVTDDNKILIYNASGTLTGEWVVTATSGTYYTEDVKSDQNGNAVVVGFYYSTGSQAEPFFAVLPETIIAGTSDNFILTAGSLGDVAGTLATNAFTTISSNAVNSITISNASNMASSTQASDVNVITAITGGSSGGGGSSIAWGGSRGFAMGGETSSRVDDIEYYDIDTTGDAADFGNLTQARNNGAAASNGTRALYASGGIPAGPTNVIDYITCATLGDATDFGDVTGDNGSEYGRTGLTGVGDGTYGIFMGGQIQSSYGSNIIDRVTIDTPGNAQDFGDLTLSVVRYSTSTNDATRGVNIAGQNQSSFLNYMDYITMATPGNATDFGDPLQQILYGSRGNVGNDTIGVFGGGYPDTNYVHSNVLQKITVQTTANATDFGDLTAGAINSAATTNGSRGMFTGLQRSGGYVVDMEYITIDTPGNATDFGDLTVAKGTASGVSGSAGGGGGGGGGSSTPWWGTRGMALGGQQGGGNSNIMQFFDITSTGNAIDFGDLTTISNGGSAGGNGERGVRIGGGGDATMDYWAFATLGNATDFGDTNITRALGATVADGTKAITGGASSGGYQNGIEYITIATTGNGTDFGDLLGADGNITGTNDTTRGIFAGGTQTTDVIQYITMATPGNAQDFGDLFGSATANMLTGTVSDNTYGVFQGGVSGYSTVIQYITIQSPGNALDFGDLAQARAYGGQTSDATSKRGVTLGGYVNPGSGGVALDSMEYITIDTPGNAADFGDLTGGNERAAGVSGVPGAGAGNGNNYGDRGVIFNASSSLDGGSDNHSQRIEYFDITTTGNAAAFGTMTQKQDVNNSYNCDRGASNGNRAVACLYHGPYPGTVGSLEYVATATLGNSASFGTNTFRESQMGLSDGTKAYYAGGPWGGGGYGSGSHTNLGTNVEVVTIETTGNATDSGYGTQNLTSGGTHGNSSRGIFAGGREDNNSGTTDINYSTQMFYITYPLSSGSSDFGDLQEGRTNCAGTGSTTRACFAGGNASNSNLKINYVEIATTGNASNFGDIDAGRNKIGATGNNTRGVFIGGYTGVQVDTMNYITIATTGDAADFGDMTAVGTGAQAMSGNAS